MTDNEYKEKAMKFLDKELKYYFDSRLYDFERAALDFVKSDKDFKYKDHVDAGAIINILVEEGYLKYEKREKNIRYHSLTEKGLEYIKNIK